MDANQQSRRGQLQRTKRTPAPRAGAHKPGGDEARGTSATTELYQSEAQFRSLIEHATDLISVLDAAGIVRYASPSHQHVLGYTQDELVGRSAFELMHPQDSSRVGSLFASALAAGSDTATTEYRYRHRDGSWRLLEAKARNLLSEPLVAGVVVNSRDITERKLAEDVSTALVRVGREIISLVDKRALLDRLCQVTAEVLGCDISYTMLRQPDADVYVPVSAFGHTPEEWESLRVMSFPMGQIPHVHERLLAGEVVPFIVGNHSGTLNRVVADAYGITSVLCMGLRRGNELYGVHTAGYRFRDEAFTPQQHQIANGISQLAALALDNTRLVDELDHANRLKSEFVATMSHELRTPLNVITGYTEMMLDGAYGALSPEHTQPLQRVRASAHGLLDLVTSTLDLSRLDSGPVGIALIDIDLAVLVGELLTETRDSLMKPGVQVEAVVDPQVTTLRSDVKKLKVILKNLLNNAVKFTDDGMITLSVARESNGVLFTVTDTGIGIATEALPLIFEPFHQAASSPQRDYGGVGLGLHIVRRLLDLLGGNIWVDSRLGSGTAARVSLPDHTG